MDEELKLTIIDVDETKFLHVISSYESQPDQLQKDLIYCLYSSILFKNLDGVKLILKHYPELINLPGNEGRTPLYQACYGHDGSNIKIVKFLLEHGADVNQYSGDYILETPIHGAAVCSKIAEVELLYSYDANIDLLTKRGPKSSYIPYNHSLLIYAAITPSPKIISFLLSKGVNVHHKDSKGYNALTYVMSEYYRWISHQLPAVDSLTGNNYIIVSLRLLMPYFTEQEIHEAHKIGSAEWSCTR